MFIPAREPDKRAKSIIKTLTHSGELELDKALLTELKSLCKYKSDDTFIAFVYDECIRNLRKEHSQVRVACIKIIDYFFQKSHCFRTSLLNDFDTFLYFSAGISQNRDIEKKSLPPPKKFASLLQELTAKTIYRWHADYSKGYEKLRYAYNHLREHKLIDFNQFRVSTLEDQIKIREAADKQERILTRSIEKKLAELEEIGPDVEQLILQIESLIDMLVPQMYTESYEESTEDNNNSSLNISEPSNSSRLHAISSSSLAKRIEIQFDPNVKVRQTNDNMDMIASLKDLRKQLSVHKIPKLIEIEKTLSRRNDQTLDRLRQVIDLKSKATNILLKLVELDIIEENDELLPRNDSSSESDFEDVEEKEDIESYIPKSMRSEYGFMSLENESACGTKPHTSLDDSLFSEASESKIISCRVRLESGKLCPRRDKVKCPFHGKIIPRDEDGVPIDESDRMREFNSSKPDRPDWQDPQLLMELELRTGIDLTLPQYAKEKKLTSNKKKLVNTKNFDRTPKCRLEKRIKLLSNG